jgi:EAL domain-containing protein (putative c-di-GMP-specific phosphodiesterase class I)
VKRVLDSEFRVGGRQLLVGASVGIAINDEGHEDADLLLRNADLAMYRAKGDRRLPFVRFEAHMHDDLLERVTTEGDLRRAVRRGELELHYQPLVDLATRRVVGVEALLRWRHRTRGLIAPGDFVALAEETGLVGEIGQWALNEACRTAVRWQTYAPVGDVFTVSVNVSAYQMGPLLPDLVMGALNDSGLPASALTLEMTETVLMERTDEMVALLEEFTVLGVNLAVDDFGTGYSSLSYLSRFPVDTLKIDRSFVEAVGRSGERTELARTIVQLGAALDLSTVAEGIELAHQAEALAAMGCTYGQGFYFAPPLTSDELDAYLAEGAGYAMTEDAGLPGTTYATPHTPLVET